MDCGDALRTFVSAPCQSSARLAGAHDDSQTAQHVAPAHVVSLHVAYFALCWMLRAGESRNDDKAQEGSENGTEREAATVLKSAFGLDVRASTNSQSA